MQTEFNRRFEDTFGLRQRGYDDKAIKFAQAAMSNMIGGIGYFYGHSLVQYVLDAFSRPFSSQLTYMQMS